MDSVLVSYRPAPDQTGPVLGTRGQAPNSVENVVVAPWNDRAAVERQFAARGAEIAAVICEPVLCNSGCLMPEPGFLEFLRRAANEHGALLLFDEIITGFRMAPGGAQEAFSVTPDLATFGKAVAGGMPLSVVAGRRDILEQMADGGVAFGGTFNGNPMSLAAAEATLAEIIREDGAALRHANRLGEALMAGIGAAALECAIPLRITGFGAAFSLHFTLREPLCEYRHTLDDRADALARYLRLMLDEGVYLLPDGRMYVSAVHTEREAEETLAAVRRVFTRFK
jgi:glutamate-1-semialdehyde 2,1-aminomutase